MSDRSNKVRCDLAFLCGEAERSPVHLLLFGCTKLQQAAGDEKVIDSHPLNSTQLRDRHRT